MNLKRKHNRGDRCECAGCQGRLRVYDSRGNPDTGFRTMYIECGVCGWKPVENKLIIPLEYAPIRSKPHS